MSGLKLTCEVAVVMVVVEVTDRGAGPEKGDQVGEALVGGGDIDRDTISCCCCCCCCNGLGDVVRDGIE